MILDKYYFYIYIFLDGIVINYIYFYDYIFENYVYEIIEFYVKINRIIISLEQVIL